jgi:hypothetical protein
MSPLWPRLAENQQTTLNGKQPPPDSLPFREAQAWHLHPQELRVRKALDNFSQPRELLTAARMTQQVDWTKSQLLNEYTHILSVVGD